MTDWLFSTCIGCQDKPHASLTLLSFGPYCPDCYAKMRVAFLEWAALQDYYDSIKANHNQPHQK